MRKANLYQTSHIVLLYCNIRDYQLTINAVSQSCVVAKSGKFWRAATGQPNLANRMEDCSTGHSTVVQYVNQTLEVFVAVSHLYAKFDCPVAHLNFSLLDTTDCETGLQYKGQNIHAQN